MRVALVSVGDTGSAAAWSGTPAGLTRGLGEHGVDVVHLTTQVPPALRAAVLGPSLAARRHRDGAWLSPEAAWVRSAALRRRLRRAAPLDGVVSLGTEAVPPPRPPYVTFEDMTVAQALALPDSPWSRLPRGVAAAWRRRQQRMYDAAAGCCATSGWAAESIVRDYGVPRERVHVVGLGANQAPRPVARDFARPVFLFVGLEWERKNGPAVLAAFRRLRAERPEAELHVAGGHPPLDEPGVHGHGVLRLDVPSERAVVAGLFERATCLVVPSRYEPYGIVYAEAAAAGIPSIGTTVGGAAEPIGPDGGVLVDPEDPEALLEAMRRCADPAQAARMGAAARERARHHTWGRVAERVLRALCTSG
jgi:glycosyltransferase involved in cell wall biosynthesis